MEVDIRDLAAIDLAKLKRRMNHARKRSAEAELEQNGREHLFTYHGGFNRGYALGKVAALEDLLDTIGERDAGKPLVIRAGKFALHISIDGAIMVALDQEQIVNVDPYYMDPENNEDGEPPFPRVQIYPINAEDPAISVIIEPESVTDYHHNATFKSVKEELQ